MHGRKCLQGLTSPGQWIHSLLSPQSRTGNTGHTVEGSETWKAGPIHMASFPFDLQSTKLGAASSWVGVRGTVL